MLDVAQSSRPLETAATGSERVSGAGLRAIVRALRRPGDEARWTQVIAAVAGVDRRFAAEFAKVLIDAAPRTTVAATVGEVPRELSCRAEQVLVDARGKDLGRADLLFEDDRVEFCLMVELKLESGYGDRQLLRYTKALRNHGAARKALLAVTKVQPLVGEDDLADEPTWLGSVRWHRVFERLYALEPVDARTTAGWRAALDVLREQGDFGVMDLDADAIYGWAKYERAEQQLRYFLTELVHPIHEALCRALGAGELNDALARPLMRGQSATQPIVPWRNRVHIKYAVPGTQPEERFRVQFHGRDGSPYFTVEARYEHPKERLEHPDVLAATEKLRVQGFEHGNDGWGWYWANLIGADQWLQGAETLDRLLLTASDSVDKLVSSGIFGALGKLEPTTFNPRSMTPDQVAGGAPGQAHEGEAERPHRP